MRDPYWRWVRPATSWSRLSSLRSARTGGGRGAAALVCVCCVSLQMRPSQALPCTRHPGSMHLRAPSLPMGYSLMGRATLCLGFARLLPVLLGWPPPMLREGAL